MGRIRSIHPGLHTDERFVSVSPFARLLWIGILNEADDFGAFEWKPITLKMRILPADNVDASALLSELEAAGLIASYEHEGVKYGLVRNFCRWQSPKKPNSKHFIPREFRKFVAMEDKDGEQVPNQYGNSSAEGRGRGRGRGESTATAEHVAARPEPPAGPDRDAIAVVALADQEFQAAFRETARAWPAPLDKAIARQWLDAGATPDLIRSVVAAQSAKLRAKGRACPVSLKFLDRDVREAIVAAKPAETSPATPRPSQRASWERHGNRAYWEDTIQGYVARPDRGWPAGIGAPPDEAGYIGPPDLAMTTADMAERRAKA